MRRKINKVPSQEYKVALSLPKAIKEDDLDTFEILTTTKSEISLGTLIDAAVYGSEKILDYILSEFNLIKSDTLLGYLGVKLGRLADYKNTECTRKLLDYLSEQAYHGKRKLTIFHWSSKGLINYVMQFENPTDDEYVKLLNKELFSMVRDMENYSESQFDEYLRSCDMWLRRKFKKPEPIEVSKYTGTGEDNHASDQQILDRLIEKQNAEKAAITRNVSESLVVKQDKYVQPVLTMEERLRIAGFNVSEVVQWVRERDKLL